MAANLERAIRIAHEAHEGETRLDGRPYVVHPMRVMAALAARGYSETTQIVGVLHDVPENNESWTIDRLREEGFGDDVLEPLALLTKPKEVGYDDYIQQLHLDPRARAVKQVDMEDNLEDYPEGMEPTPWRRRQVEKYARALLYLASQPQQFV